MVKLVVTFSSTLRSTICRLQAFTGHPHNKVCDTKFGINGHKGWSPNASLDK